jgi:gamma-glutamylcysteine synthetase
MLKSVMEQYQETKTFQDGFAQYVNYLINHPNSFITRYIGYYSVQACALTLFYDGNILECKSQYNYFHKNAK